MTDKQTNKTEGQPTIGVWLNGGFSGKLNLLPLINFCGVFKASCYETRHR